MELGAGDNKVHNWEVYAWAVRDAMSKASGMLKNEQAYREKLEYENILGF